ncbi:tyrosine-type recombinase/integrase [soil metagenome]
MKTSGCSIGPLLQKFFVDYLCTQKRSSPETVSSYRDTFRLLLQFIHNKYKIEPVALRIEDVTVPLILDFLDYLEKERKNSVRSRNLRLAAIRSFFRIVALYEPACVNQSSCVLAIPVKRCDRKIVKTLSSDEIFAILAAPDITHWRGRRDHAILLTLYNSGARISELAGLRQNQIRFGTSTFIHLTGKGRKERSVPLWPKTARVLRSWFEELAGSDTDLAFPNLTKMKLTRNGLDYILQRAVQGAKKSCHSLENKSVTPHVIRHTTATHLLQSGVDLAVIALWLGHESTDTTHIYLESDLVTKERALNKLAAPTENEPIRYHAEDKVLAFLASF